MTDRNSLLNRLRHQDISDLHGVPARQHQRQPIKIDVPPQGAVSPHTKRHSKRRDSRGIPTNNVVYSDNLYGDGLAASPAAYNNDAFLGPSRNNDRPSPRSRNAPTERSSVFPQPYSIKGRALQFEQNQPSPSTPRSSAASLKIAEQDFINLDSDEEKSDPPLLSKSAGSDYSETFSSASSSKALAAKDERRRLLVHDSSQNSGSNGARRPGPIPLEQPSDSRTAAVRRKWPFDATAPSPSQPPLPGSAEKDRNSSMAARMKAKDSSTANTSHAAARSSGSARGEDPLHRLFKGSSPVNRQVSTKSAQSAQTMESMQKGVEIALQRLVISDIWRTADETSCNLVVVFRDQLLDLRHGQHTLFSIRYADMLVIECTKSDVTSIGLISISLKPSSFSVADVQRQFRHFDPRASADTCELLMVAKTDASNLRLQRGLVEVLGNLSVSGTRWLDEAASQTKFRCTNSVRAAPWPGSGVSTSSAQELTAASRPKRELILPGNDRPPSPKNTRSDRRSSNVEIQISPEQRKASAKTFNLYSDSLDDIFTKASPPPEPNSPPLQKLVVPAKRPPAASDRAETRSRTKLFSNNPVVQFPFEGIGAVSLLESDLRRLDDGELLNDTVIEFAMKLMHEDIRKRDPQLADSIYIFNTFFYKILTESKEMESSYNKVRKWTSKIDLFSKKYIVVPINEDLHWYLALIINPCFMLQTTKDPSPPPASKRSTARRLSVANTSNNETVDSARSAADDSGSCTGQRPGSPDFPHQVPEELESFFFHTPVLKGDFPLPRDTSATSVTSNVGTTPLSHLAKDSPAALNTSSNHQRFSSGDNSLNSPPRSPTQSTLPESPHVDWLSPKSSLMQVPVDDLRKKPTHIKFDEFGEPDLSVGKTNQRQADSRWNSIPHDNHQGLGSTVEGGQKSNVDATRVDHDSPPSRKRPWNWTEELAQNESMGSDRSYDAMDGEEIRRVARGKLEGGGPTIDLSDNGAGSSSATRSRTRIVPGDGRRSSNEAVGASSFYSSSHRKQRKANKSNAMDLDAPDPPARRNRRKTASRLFTSSPEPDSPSTPVFVDLDTLTASEVSCDLDRCFVITLDSLGIQHKNVGKQLREYLWREAKDKEHLRQDAQSVPTQQAKGSSPAPNKPPASFPDPFCFQSLVPQQPNFCDCGIYLLHYFDRFFNDPDLALRLAVGSAEARASRRRTRAGGTPAEQGEKMLWEAGNVHGKRQYWKNRALLLSEGWKEFQEHRNAGKLRSKNGEEDSDIILKSQGEPDSMEVEPQDAPAPHTAAPQPAPEVSLDSTMDDLDPIQSAAISNFDSRGIKSPSVTTPVPVEEPEPTSQQPVLRSRVKGRLSSRSLRREGSSDVETPARTVHLVDDSDDEASARG